MPAAHLTATLAIGLATLIGCTNRQAAVGSPSGSAPFTAITFERTPCFGTCPVYRVRVSGSGSVSFTGIRNVDSVGTFTGHIDAAAVQALRKAFEDAKYTSLLPAYGQSNCSPYGTDAARILTSITTGDQTKSVDHDLGCGNAAPAALPDLYRKFDSIVGITRWMGNR
jgi:hypothetical protein